MGYALIIETDKSIRGDLSSFHLSMFGMQTYRREMDRFGMVDFTLDFPKFGRMEDFLNDTEYEVHAEMVREFTPANPLAITGYKLCSNDGWLVTPAEITSALESFEARKERGWTVDVQDKRYWNQFIAFLKRAAKHNGFRVW